MGRIHDAAFEGDIITVKQLLEEAPTLLMSTNDKGELPIHLAAGKGQIEIVKLLLDKGCPVDAQVQHQYENDTPLYQAACYGKKEVVAYLLDKGADPSVKNKQNKTPYQITKEKSAYHQQNEETTKLMEQRGAAIKGAGGCGIISTLIIVSMALMLIICTKLITYIH